MKQISPLQVLLNTRFLYGFGPMTCWPVELLQTCWFLEEKADDQGRSPNTLAFPPCPQDPPFSALESTRDCLHPLTHASLHPRIGEKGVK